MTTDRPPSRRRRALISVALLLGSLTGSAALGGWWLSVPGYTGPPSDHFDGTRFANAEPTTLPDLGMALQLVREGRGPDWQARTYLAQPPPPARVTGESLRATFINHATVLVQHDGMNVLTDPIWSQRCSAVQFAGPARHHAPGVALEDLPPIDVILISHNHYDHLDLNTLATLARRDDPVLVVPLGNGPTVAHLGFSRVVELDWGQATAVGPLTITGQQVRHFSGRGLFDRQKTLWMGAVVRGPAGAWYFAGDTGYGPHFAASAEAHGPFRLALLPIGAYAPRWFMSPIHMDPAQAVQAQRDLGGPPALGVHFGTFRLTTEGQDTPLEALADALSATDAPEGSFRALEPGQAWDVP